MMDKKVLLLHGWGGSDYPHWQSWIAGEIAKDYGCVNFPLLKDKEFPKKELWLEQLKKHLKDFKPNIVITHSLGNTLWFHLCNEQKIEGIEHLLLVAPPSNSSKIKELETFFPCQLPSSLCAKHTTLVTSDSDPYMSVNEANELASNYDLKHITLHNAGHINADSGHTEWSFVKEWIKDIT